MKRSSLFAAVLFVIGAPLAAQDARLHARLDPATADSVDMLIAAARARSVPSEPLVQKALEGASKNASRNSILHAVSALSDRLAAARHALGASASEAELTAAAAALYAGVDAATLQQLRSLRPGASLAMPLVSLSYFLQQGVPRNTAVDWISTIVRKDISPDELLRVHMSIEGDVKAGALPRAATNARVEALLRQHRDAPQ